MFFGTTPSIVSQYLFEEISKHKPTKVYVLFAGNFVVEQLAKTYSKEIELISTDVSLYSRAIGFGATDKASNIKLREELLQDFPIFQNKNTPFDIACQIIFFSDVGNAIQKKSKIPYYENVYKDAKANQEKYLENITKKMQTFKDLVGTMNFVGQDACNLIPLIQEKDFVFYDPPVILGDYEKMFKNLENCFEYQPEPYTEITEELKRTHLEQLSDIGTTLYYRTNNPLKDVPKGYKECYRYQYKHNAYYCVYSNIHLKTFVGSFSPLREKAKDYKILSSEDVLTENTEIEIMQVKTEVANHYRLMWVKKATMTSAGYSFLLFADKKLIGVLTLVEGVKLGTDLVSIFSDPCTPTSNYKRLSKLIIYLASTWEVINTISEVSMWEHKGVTTRVFTNEPISMKYRGLFDLVDRKEDKDGNYKYKIIYQNRKNIFSTLKEAYLKWFKKYKKDLWKK